APAHPVTPLDRRGFLTRLAALTGGAGLAGCVGAGAFPGAAGGAGAADATSAAGAGAADATSTAGAGTLARPGSPDHPFRISLAEWSLHRTIRAGALDPLDFAPAARARYGLAAVEHVNQFFQEQAGRAAYFARMRRRADDAGVASLLIMCDAAGALGAPDRAARAAAVERHALWLDAAAELGCHSIRVNAESRGTPAEQLRLCADGLYALCERAETLGLGVLVENHGGGLSGDGAWLASLMRKVDHPRMGTLPDFGNFAEGYDRYRGVAELVPWARAVSAKSHAFDGRGEETGTDYLRMLALVLDAGYRGWVGVEYEGDALPEDEGIRATIELLRRVREELAPRYG
ncbi:MAG TPA: TIM barrel protein, partial [Longimicrobiales bacterium]|nr:TIM barrel protein [Longimicrobiales bacterium]